MGYSILICRVDGAAVGGNTSHRRSRSKPSLGCECGGKSTMGGKAYLRMSLVRLGDSFPAFKSAPGNPWKTAYVPSFTQWLDAVRAQPCQSLFCL
ncbi:hypothetical protein AZA_27948 [Nitrospirillum viridazoti Y2]|nr:hypothetical protein AZA_27948 [Nitrospirillum amazonense Y2]